MQSLESAIKVQVGRFIVLSAASHNLSSIPGLTSLVRCGVYMIALCVTALCHLRSLSIYEKDLAKAQELMLDTCKKADGTYVKMSYSNSISLRANDNKDTISDGMLSMMRMLSVMRM